MPVTNYTVVEGELLSENRAGTKRDYLPDPLGSTVALLDNTQTKTDTYTYWPYGEAKSHTGTSTTPFDWVGTLGYYREPSLRFYVRARYYLHNAGVWQTEDPIGFDGGDWNLYRYVKSKPVSSVDPTGLIVQTQPSNCWTREYMDLVRQGYSLREACRLANQFCGTKQPCIDLPPVPPAPCKRPPIKPTPPGKPKPYDDDKDAWCAYQAWMYCKGWLESDYPEYFTPCFVGTYYLCKWMD